MTRALLQQALDIAKAYREWVDAVPKDIVLPAMPGHDRDWSDKVIDKCERFLRAELAKPEQKPFFQFRECEDSQAGQPEQEPDMKLFSDCKTDKEKSNFLLSGRGYETGVVAKSIQNDVAMAYHRLSLLQPAQEPLTPHEIGEYVGTHEYGPEELKWFRLGEAAHGIGSKA